MFIKGGKNTGPWLRGKPPISHSRVFINCMKTRLRKVSLKWLGL
jgi:hypothetical protein